MKIRQIKIEITILQVFLLAALFLPAANDAGSSALSTAELALRYAQAGFTPDMLFYFIGAVGSPVATAFCLWLIFQRRNFTVASWLGAFTCMTHVCFYSAVRTFFSGSVTLKGTYLAVCLLAVINLFMCIRGYLDAAPPHRPGGDRP